MELAHTGTFKYTEEFQMRLLNYLLVIMLFMIATSSAFAQEVASNVEPVMSFIAIVIKFINETFPKAGPYIQGGVEIIFSLSAFFTILTVFVIGFLKIPIVVARMKGAREWEIKIQKFSDKVGYYLKFLSSFNAKKK